MTVHDEHYCIFQIGEALFALEATCLREVGLRPTLANIPMSHDSFAGLWHEGSEFLPVVRLTPRPESMDGNDEQQMLVIHRDQGAWAILADHVVGIEPLECTHGETANLRNAWSDATQGTANRDETLVQVLNHEKLYQVVEQTINESWNAARCG